MNKYYPFYLRNLKLAFPIIISQIGQVMVQQIDTMMVGYVGTVELAASAFANSIFIIGMVITMGFTFGITPVVGHLVSDKSKNKINSILSNAIAINIAFSILITLLLYVASFFFNQMGQVKAVEILAQPYYISIVLSLIPLIIFFTFKQFAEGIGDTKNAMFITVSSNIINIVLNYILIFGKFGFPEMGLLGAGIATLISRIYMAIGLIGIFLYKKTFNEYINKISIHLINKADIKKLFSVGMPISMQLLLEVLAFGLTAIMAGWLGVIPLAAHQIAIGLASISFMIVVGVGSATTIRISHQLSHKDYEGLLIASKASIHIILGFMSISAIIFLSLRNYLPLLYTNDNQVIILTAHLLMMAAIFQLFDGLQIVMISILRGIGDVRHAMIYAFIAYILINIPLGYFLSFTLNFGIIGLWIGLIVGLFVASILFYSRFKTIFAKLV